MRYFIDNIKTYANVNKKGRAVLILCVWAMRKASGSYRILFLFDIIVLMINIGIIGFAIGCLSNMR